MKAILIFCMSFALALAILPACALAAPAESPIILGGTGDDVCYDTLLLPNGNLILSMSSGGGRNGEPEYDENVHKVWLLCLAPDGSTVWENEYGEERSGGYTSLWFLALGDDGTFRATESYDISQHRQYLQEKVFSCEDGSLLSQGERSLNPLGDGSVYIQYRANGGYMLVEESLSVDSPDSYRTLSMLDPQGRELWRLDADAYGIRNVDGWFLLPQGMLLYGRHPNDALQQSQPIVMLVGAHGDVLWSYVPAGLTNGIFWDGIIDSAGRIVLTGITRGAKQTDENGSESRIQLVTCLDTATGEEIWRKTAEMSERSLPCKIIAELNGQIILCDSGNSYQNKVFETLDWNGNELQYWTASVPGYGQISPHFFQWNGELWTYTILEGNTMDVLLERVVLP